MRKLYLYMKAEYLDSVLEKDEIKVILPKDCNDPFELTPKGETPAAEFYRQDVGMICFSEDYRSTLMWAHYADRGRGVCLEFEFPESQQHLQVAYEEEGEGVPDEKNRTSDVCVINVPHPEQYTALLFADGEVCYLPLLMKVKYSPYRAHPAKQIVTYTYNSESQVEDARYSRLFATKGQEWAYEKEWRLFVSLDGCTIYRDGHYFVKGLIPFLSCIYLGVNCPLPRRKIEQKLRSVSIRPRTHCKRMQQHESLFAFGGEAKPDAKDRWTIPLNFTQAEWNTIIETIRKRSGDQLSHEDYVQLLRHDILNTLYPTQN